MTNERPKLQFKKDDINALALAILQLQKEKEDSLSNICKNYMMMSFNNIENEQAFLTNMSLVVERFVEQGALSKKEGEEILTHRINTLTSNRQFINDLKF
jgi:hypothetical protein